MKYDYEQTFTDWHAFLDHCENAPCLIPEGKRASDSRSRDTSSGYGNLHAATWPKACELAHNGWPEGKDKINDLATSLFSFISQYAGKPEPQYLTEGINLDVGRWHEGEPEHWLAMGESETVIVNGKTTAKIGVNLSASCGISTETMTARGACILALSRLLDYMGIRTQIDVLVMIGVNYNYTGDRILCTVEVKHFNQDFDLDRLSYALAHSSMSRRHGFAWFETLPSKDLLQKYTVYPTSMYGYPSDPFPETLATRGYDVYLGSAMWGDCQWNNPRAAQEWIVKELAKLGIVINLPPESKLETPKVESVPYVPKYVPYVPKYVPGKKRKRRARRY